MTTAVGLQPRRGRDRRADHPGPPPDHRPRACPGTEGVRGYVVSGGRVTPSLASGRPRSRRNARPSIAGSEPAGPTTQSLISTGSSVTPASHRDCSRHMTVAITCIRTTSAIRPWPTRSTWLCSATTTIDSVSDGARRAGPEFAWFTSPRSASSPELAVTAVASTNDLAGAARAQAVRAGAPLSVRKASRRG